MTILKIVDNTLIPSIDAIQMIEIDRAMVEDYKITLIQMMENAGYKLATLARRRFFGDNTIAKTAAILVGSDGNDSPKHGYYGVVLR